MQPIAIDEALETAGLDELALVIAELEDLRIVAASSSVAEALELPASAILGRTITEFLREEDQPKAVQALTALRDGVIDFYRASRVVLTPPGRRKLNVVWTRAVEFDRKRLALVELGGAESRTLAQFDSVLRRDPEMVVGMTDEGWSITAVSREVIDALGVAPNALVGRRLQDLLEPQHAERLERSWEMMSEHCVVSLVAHTSSEFKGWENVCCVLTNWSPERAHRGFLLIRAHEPSPNLSIRGDQLARHLWNIAAEVEASGILQRISPVPDLTREPKMRLLSTRQWDIVNRLLQGQRVPAIAKELFISQSTVRNHLAHVFERFEVHSQGELLAHLRGIAG